MPYTLMKGLAWILIAVVIGLVIGWLLRSVAAKRQIERARAARPESEGQEELERLRGRVANLEPVVNERDRLRAELDRVQRQPPPPPSSAPPPDVAAVATRGATEPGDDRVDAASSVDPDVATDVVAVDTADAETADVGVAADVLGKRVELDDLTAIEGIGPKIAELCHGIGIRTWAELSTTEVSLLRTMLTDAGQRFKAHDPSTWPQQAGLLARGAWSEFKALTDRLDGGRAVD